MDSREILKQYFEIYELDEARADRKLIQFFEAYEIDIPVAVQSMRETLEKASRKSSREKEFEALERIEDALHPKLY